jgi:nitrate reductase NapAB chaperone NapD
MQTPADSYSIAGVVVRTAPEHVPEVAMRLAELPGVDVHHREVSTGRIVMTLETEGVDESDGLERLRLLPQVLTVELVYHYADQDGEPRLQRPDEISTPGRDDGRVR